MKHVQFPRLICYLVSESFPWLWLLNKQLWHLSIYLLLVPELWGQQLEHLCPNPPLPALQGDITKPERHIQSVLGLSWGLGHVWDVCWGHFYQMPKPPPLVPLSVEEQWLSQITEPLSLSQGQTATLWTKLILTSCFHVSVLSVTAQRWGWDQTDR